MHSIFRLLDNTSNVVTNESKLVWPSFDGLCERELAVAIGLVDFLVEYQNGKLVLIDGAQRTVDVSPAITIVLFALLSLLGDLFFEGPVEFHNTALGGFNVAQVVYDTRIHPFPFDVHFADRQPKGEDRPITAQPFYFPAHTNDPGLAGTMVVGHVFVVILPVRGGHQHINLLSNYFGGGVGEERGCGWVH